MWGIIVGIGQFIFGLFQGAIDAIVASLVVAVQIAQIAIVSLWNALKAAGVALMTGFAKAWDFLKPLYTDLLKPAWQKFWTWFDTARAWLEKTFGPILQFLRTVRDTLLKYWQEFVQPWLDLIDVTRKGLRVLAALGLDWARQLDAELGKLEDKIQAPFLYLLGKLNEVINAVNLVVGADGLLQRVALIRSMFRDYQYCWKAIVKPYSAPVDPDTQDQIRQGIAARTLDDVEHDYQQYLRDQTGALSPAVDAAVAAFRARLHIR